MAVRWSIERSSRWPLDAQLSMARVRQPLAVLQIAFAVSIAIPSRVDDQVAHGNAAQSLGEGDRLVVTRLAPGRAHSWVIREATSSMATNGNVEFRTPAWRAALARFENSYVDRVGRARRSAHTWAQSLERRQS